MIASASLWFACSQPAFSSGVHLFHLQHAAGNLNFLAFEKFRSVRLAISNQSLKVICRNNEQEEAQEELEITYGGDVEGLFQLPGGARVALPVADRGDLIGGDHHRVF